MRILATKEIVEGSFKSYKGSDITEDWVFGNADAMLEPFVIESAEGLGMEMPPNDITISKISEIVGTFSRHRCTHPTHTDARV